MDNYYALLGISEFTYDQKVIRSAYMDQIKFFHPDLYAGPPEIAQTKTQQLNEAYRVLRDADRKADYDNLLRAEKAKLQQQYSAAYNAKRYREQSYSSRYRPSHTSKHTRSRGLFKIFFTIFILLLLSYVAFLVLSSFRTYDTPSSEGRSPQSVIEHNDSNAAPFNGNAQSGYTPPNR